MKNNIILNEYLHTYGIRNMEKPLELLQNALASPPKDGIYIDCPDKGPKYLISQLLDEHDIKWSDERQIDGSGALLLRIPTLYDRLEDLGLLVMQALSQHAKYYRVRRKGLLKKDIMALFFLCQKTESYLDIPRPILGYDEIFGFVQELLQENKLSWDRNQSDKLNIEFSSQHPTKVHVQPIFTVLNRFKPESMICVKASLLYNNNRFRNDYYFELSKDWGVDPVAEVPLGVCASIEFEMFLESANLVKKGNELIKISLLEKEFLSCAKKFGLNMNVSKIIAGRKRKSSGREELERVKEAPFQEEKDVEPDLIRPARTLVCRKGEFTFTKNQFPIIELFFDNYDNGNNYISEQDALVKTDEAIKAKKSGEVDRYSMSSFKSIFKSRRAYFKAIFEQHPEEKDLWRLNLD